MEGLQLVYDSRGLYLWLMLFGLLALLAGIVFLLHVRLASVVAHYRLLTRGVAGARLDELLERHLDRADANAARLSQVTEQCAGLEHAQAHSLQRVGIVRFNPFSDVGGDQSFSIALLDATGDGLVISSLFGRNESRVYAKPIAKGQSKYSLSEEEEQAIRLARGPAVAQRAR